MENNSRRNFLKTGAVAGAALLATSTIGTLAPGCSDREAEENKNKPQKSAKRY